MSDSGFSNCWDGCPYFIAGRLACWCVRFITEMGGEAQKVRYGDACHHRGEPQLSFFEDVSE